LSLAAGFDLSWSDPHDPKSNEQPPSGIPSAIASRSAVGAGRRDEREAPERGLDAGMTI
jgi:hypothetical protein